MSGRIGDESARWLGALEKGCGVGDRTFAGQVPVVQRYCIDTSLMTDGEEEVNAVPCTPPAE